MSRRPSIQPDLLPKDEYVPYGTYNEGYSQGAYNKEVVGQKRGDWFRCECRDCGQKMITNRKENGTRYFKCQSCGKLHHINGGFFTLPSKNHGTETVPLKQEEVDGILCRAKLSYKGDMEPDWFYGEPEYLEDKIDGYFELQGKFEIVGEVESADIASRIEEMMS